MRVALTTSVPIATSVVPKATTPSAAPAARRPHGRMPTIASTSPYSSVRFAPSQASPFPSAHRIDR